MAGAEVTWKPDRPKQPGREARSRRRKRPSAKHGQVVHPPKPGRCSWPLGCTELARPNGYYCLAHYEQVVARGAELRRLRLAARERSPERV